MFDSCAATASVDAAWLDAEGESWAQRLEQMNPLDRFEAEFGIPATPQALATEGASDGSESQEAAASTQAALVQADRVLRIAEAHRMVALLHSYEVSLADLGARFGRGFGTRQGRGASTFFSSTALRTMQNPLHVAHLVDTGLLARDRLPRTWAVFLAGGTTWRAVDTAVRQADGLDLDRWDVYDRVAAEQVGTSTRLKDVLRRARERLQDDTADARARTTFERRAVHLDHGPDGSATWSMTGPVADQVAWDAALTKAAIAAKVAGEGRTVTQLRYDIARDLIIEGLQRAADPRSVVPERRGVTVQLILTVPALGWLGRTSEQAMIAGHGPVAMDTARALAAEATSMVRVLTDSVTGVRLAMDRTARLAPIDLRRWLIARDQWCRFPGCRRPAHACDLDHLTEWQHHGVTDDNNLLSECRRHHSAKSVELYRAELDSGGWARWTDPWDVAFSDPPAAPMDPAPRDLLPSRDPDGPPPF